MTTNRVSISKMETVDVKKERERFGQYQLTIGTPEHLLIGRDNFYHAHIEREFQLWLAAKKQAAEEMVMAGYQYRLKREGRTQFAWSSCSKDTYDAIQDERLDLKRYEARIVYAKKGE